MSGKVAARGLIFVAVCLIIGAGLFLFHAGKPAKKYSPNNFNFKRVQYRFQVWNTANQPVSNAHFYVHAPVDLTGAQRCIRIESSHPFELVTDTLGNQVLKFTFETFAPLSSKIVSVQANLMLAKTPVAVPKSDPKRFSNPTPDIEAKEIRQLADQLKSGNAHTTTENIYHWVADNIAYTGYAQQAKGVQRTLLSRKGDCTEFADLFVALTRAAGIPARRVSGYLTHENGTLKAADYHDWAEIYENGIWRIVDAQQRNFDARYPDYIAMKIYDHSPQSDPMAGFQRFYVDGKGLKAKMDS